VASSVKIPVKITCNGATLEQVEKFCYLGSIITETSDCHKEILTRLGIARSVLTSLNCLWKDRALSMSLKSRLLQTLAWPVASYGSESWTLKAADKKRLVAFEMTAYRRMMRISWTEHRTNQSILVSGWTVSVRVIVFWQPFSDVNWSTSAMLSELKTSLQMYYMVASMVTDLVAGRNDAGQMMWRTGLVYRFQNSSHWLKIEQHGDPSCRHHWGSIFRNEEEPTTTT